MLTDELIRAIRARRLVAFRYHECERVVEPHDLGVAGGVEQLLAYQIGGESRSGSLPEWRRFDVADLRDLRLLEETFPGSRPAPSGRHSSWDRTIVRVGE